MLRRNKMAIGRVICAGTWVAGLAFLSPAQAQGHGTNPAAVTAAPARSTGRTVTPAALPPAAALPSASTFSCTTPAEFARFSNPLRHTARRIAAGEPLTIVAVGSSSTAGAGASSPAASYPSRLAIELKQRFPALDITVLNRGVNGEETPQMMARFQSGVLSAHPNLVLWQVGTNSVLRDHPLKPHSVLLHEGIAELKAAGADVVLIDMQFAPRVIAKSETPSMEDQIALVAKEANVDLFNRFAVMRNWREVEHIPFAAFVAPDQLHMNDWGYACVAKLLATAITEAATRPTASAAASGR